MHNALLELLTMLPLAGVVLSKGTQGHCHDLPSG